MENLNNAFFFVTNKIIDLQDFFIGVAKGVGRITLLIALLTAGLNYAITGTGLKENIVKIMKATLFFLIVIFFYPKIIGGITKITFDMARNSVGNAVEKYYQTNKAEIAGFVDGAGTTVTNVDGNTINSYLGASVRVIKETSPGDPAAYFDDLIKTINHPNMTYYAVPPAAVFKIILLTAGNCFKFADDEGGWTKMGNLFKGLICAFFIILTGAFAILEYLMAFMEFMLVSSVGVILFPLSIWDASKFMSEKFIGAILGFFIKLLFCNISIFLLLYGFISLAHMFIKSPFKGQVDQVVTVIFICLLFFYVCKSAPGLAQSLLTGTPSLSASGAISAVGGAVGGAAAAAGLAKSIGGSIAGGAAKTAFGASGALTQASSAAKAAGLLGGGASDKAAAFMGSIGNSAKEQFKASAGDLARNLIGDGSGGGGSRGSGAGLNRHSHVQKFLDEKNADGTKKTFGEYLGERRSEGDNYGLDYMANEEAKNNRNNA
jgi:hypothetical protein